MRAWYFMSRACLSEAMQLESTLFGVAVVQIKPQLEKLLNLAEDSLTKAGAERMRFLIKKCPGPGDFLGCSRRSS